jgi:hypothetical protein
MPTESRHNHHLVSDFFDGDAIAMPLAITVLSRMLPEKARGHHDAVRR